MAMNKRKKTTAVVATVTAAVLLLGGTFAWTSISQQAKNEAIVDINPGGRLHDDFNGANKDVYVENFGDEITGVNIFARIRLDEYFEVGQEAGKNKDTDMSERNVEAKIGEDINDVTTWQTYKPAETLSDEISVSDYWTWYLGNDDSNMPYYMPTFNMNKDSLAADINGTYEGTTPDDIVHYDDYKVYNADSKITAEETHDWDEDTTEEDGVTVQWDNGGVTTDRTTPIDSADVLKEENEHTAEMITTTAEVITMAQWLAPTEEGGMNGQPGPYWVYDEDGWAYWAQPIAPGETTGLLLDGINMSKVPDDNWYYGINVVGQFATASDWEMFFAPEAEGGAGEGQMTDNAKTLMELITETTNQDSGTEENPPVEVPTYYNMDVAYPLESGTEVNLGVPDYVPTSEDGLSFYVINKENNPNGGSDEMLPEEDGKQVVTIVFESAGGLIIETKYYYAVPFINGSTATTSELVEGVTYVAMDGDNVVAHTSTKVYDSSVHTYMGMGSNTYDEGQIRGCMVFAKTEADGTYCVLGDANVGVDGDDEFVQALGVTAAPDGSGYAYDVATITETPCSCSESADAGN